MTLSVRFMESIPAGVQQSRSHNLFIGEIASDGSNAGLAAARRDDLGQGLTWASIGISADRYG